MRTKLVFTLSAVGVLVGLASAYVYARHPSPLPPAFNPSANPYDKGVYAQGIVESVQAQGSNINIYPEVAGPVTKVLVAEGQSVRRGDPLLTVDDTVQRPTADQLRAQADAALATLVELKAQPRPETLRVTQSQLLAAKAMVEDVQDHLTKMEAAYKLDPASVTLDALDDARNAVKEAVTNLAVAQRQLDLTAAGAWAYDVKVQDAQQQALRQASAASDALLLKYTVRAPCDGIVLSVATTAGSYVSPTGAYDSYTQAFDPLVVMGTAQGQLAVRCYVDEILVSRLPTGARMTAKMLIRGTDVSVPLTFERIQPYVSPKIELADERLERVDVRVLPVIFRFGKPAGINLFPGQLVDVYIGDK